LPAGSTFGGTPPNGLWSPGASAAVAGARAAAMSDEVERRPAEELWYRNRSAQRAIPATQFNARPPASGAQAAPAARTAQAEPQLEPSPPPNAPPVEPPRRLPPEADFQTAAEPPPSTEYVAPAPPAQPAPQPPYQAAMPLAPQVDQPPAVPPVESYRDNYAPPAAVQPAPAAPQLPQAAPWRPVATPQQPQPPAPAPPQPGELFEEGQVVAVVGDERILAGDIMGVVNQWMEANREKIPPGREEQFRNRVMEQVLEGEIQNKLVYLDFLRQVRSKGGEDKITEIHNRIYEQFDEKRLLDMMEKAKAASPVELDAKLREQGSSLMKHKRQFAEKVMGQQWLRETDQINHKPVVTHGQMLDYYYAHVSEYEFPAEAKWEHLMTRFNKFPNKAAAWDAIAAMGNEVALGGAPLWAVAKRSSHGVTASDGGQFEKTTKGSLKSKVLDEAIFTLPLRELSPILEDEEGFHIVRVLDRRDAGRTSFETTQSEIKEKLEKEQVDKQIAAYLADLRKTTPVWTIFDKDKKQREQEEARRNSPYGAGTR
jgi:parvulin-like peptidyl-prolyl isomerase